MNDAHSLPGELIALDIAVPPMLEAALAYEGPARWVGFFWQYDDARAHDSRFNLPVDWYTWRVFTEHLMVTVVLAPYDFGGEAEGTHLLLLDRGDRRLYAAPTAVGHAFLASQWTPQGELPAAELRRFAELSDLADLVTEASHCQSIPTTPGLATEVADRMQRTAANDLALASWLAEHLPKPDLVAEQDILEQALAALLRHTEHRGE